MTEFAPAKIDDRGNVSHGDDTRIYVEFDNRPVLNEYKSEQAGHPVHDEVTFISMTFPGNTTTKIVRPVILTGDMRDDWRFPNAWQKFQNQLEQVPDGWRIEDWPVLTRTDVENFKSLKIFTVEALASLPDTALERMGHGARTVRDKAVAAIEQAKDGAVNNRLISENENLRLEIDRLKKAVDDLSAKQAKTTGK